MTKKAAAPIYCWDSSVWLAWIKQEATHPLADMELVASEITEGTAQMLVPATVYEELQLTRCTDEQLAMIEAFLKRPNVLQATQTPAVSRRAADIIKRSLKDNLVTKLNDARIAASAIVFGASVLHSVDNGLLRLDGTSIVNGLAIKRPKPLSGQKGLG